VNTRTILRASAHTKPSGLAGAIAGMIRGGKIPVVIQAIGAGAVNQAAKAVAIAHSYLVGEHDVICYLAFETVTIGDRDISSLKFFVEPR